MLLAFCLGAHMFRHSACGFVRLCLVVFIFALSTYRATEAMSHDSPTSGPMWRINVCPLAYVRIDTCANDVCTGARPDRSRRAGTAPDEPPRPSRILTRLLTRSNLRRSHYSSACAAAMAYGAVRKRDVTGPARSAKSPWW